MTPLIHLDPRYAWQRLELGAISASYIGRKGSIAQLLAGLPATESPVTELIAGRLASLDGHFAAVVEGPGWGMAVADKVASYPIFYIATDQMFMVSNSARRLRRESRIADCNPEALLELRTAGYVTGADTLLRGLRKLQAGEMLYWCADAGAPCQVRYYRFYSQHLRGESEATLIDELDLRTNAIIDRNIADANGRRVIVPLSGGLDSRVILAKLKARGCPNLRAFSYGVPGNYEARVAQQVAEKLDIPWEFVPTTREQANRFFHSDQRREYWEFADGLHLVPNLHTLLALEELERRGRFEGGAVLVNGQSGDFIAGDHIPPTILSGPSDRQALYDNIIGKHYSHRRALLRNDEVQKMLRHRIDDVIGFDHDLADPQQYAKVHELWEWQARQAIRVLNGQRNYDFLGLRWELPLWEREYLEFWMEIPLEHKLGRRLFRRWLEREDFGGLFRNYHPFLSRWPKHLIWIQHLGRALTLMLGRGVSARYYETLDYFSHYSYLYAAVSYREYLGHCRNYRGIYPYYVDTWESENSGLFQGGLTLPMC
jgi:asparagine synthase (glutamine-hydrolysing)